MASNGKLFWALITLATLLLVLLIVSQLVGCGGIEPPEIESWSVESVGDPEPRYFEGDLVIEWLEMAVVIDYDQYLFEPFTSGVCIDVLNQDRVLIYRACGECAWGVEDCRLTRQPVIADE